MSGRGILEFAGFAEPVSSLSHLIGAVLLWLGSGYLRPLAGESAVRRWSIFLYVLCSCGMFVFSSLYHLVPGGHGWQEFFWRMDHAMIWLTIASTIVAIHTLADLGTALLGWVTWIAAWAGLIIEQVYLEAMPPWLSPTLYIALGWIGVVPCWRLARDWGARYAAPVIVAGALCTVGGVSDALAWPVLASRVVEGHEVMHTLILAGLVFFYVAVLQCARIVHPADLGRDSADRRVEPALVPDPAPLG